jgi:hypothetical protein
MVRKRVAKARSVTSRSLEFTLDNRLLKLSLRGIKFVMITRLVARRLLFSLSLLLPGSFFFATFASGKPHGCAGRLFEDSVDQGGPQSIPGGICADYVLGGGGVADHDSDATNNGSGALNPANGTYLNQFHIVPGVDASYTKFHDQIGDNPYNLVLAPENLLYLAVDFIKTPLHFVELSFFSNFVGAEVLLESSGRKAAARIPGVDTGANR